MARISLSLLLLGCTLLQYTLAEFGSTGTVQSSQTIKDAAISATGKFDILDAKNGYVVVTMYTLFTTVLPKMESLGTNFKTRGKALTESISNAVPNTSRDYNAVFDPILNAATALIALIDGEQATTRSELTTLLGTDDIDHLFGDVFGNMRLATERVHTAFTQLKNGVRTAPVVGGRSRVSFSVVTSAVLSVNLLMATIPAVEYTIQVTIEHIEYGDQFLNSLELMNTDMINNLQTYLSDFREALLEVGGAIADAKDFDESDWTAIVDGVGPVTSNLATLSEYATFDGALTSLSTSYDSLVGIDDNVVSVFTTYLSAASEYLDQFQEILVPRDYLAITYLLDVIVAGGAHGEFCFFKFGPRLVNYYLRLTSDVENCFGSEIQKLTNLYDIALAILDMIMFDLEDLLDNLEVCDSSATPGACIDAIGPLYVALFAETDFKVNYFLDLTTAEASASISRLGACMYAKKIANMQKLLSAKTDIEHCRADGPDAPDLGE